MTKPPADPGRAARRVGSVRDPAPASTLAPRVTLSRPSGPIAGLALLVIAAICIDGFRPLSATWVAGDLLYHQALARELLRGTFPLEGPYLGLPTYYPPGFHALLAATMAVLGLDAVPAINLLTVLLIPLLPIGTFLLTRQVTRRPWVALLAATLVVFAGGYDLAAGRLWVNALFVSGHNMWPVYPRDVVFALLPFAAVAFLRALEGSPRSALGWGLVAGLLLGAAALVQAQLLLPLPLALAAAVVAAMRPGRRHRFAVPIAVALTAGGVTLAAIAPWLGQLAAIRANGGVALDSSDALEPARFGFWSYPKEFGLLLPLAILGAGVVILLLRRPDGPRVGSETRGRWAGASVPGAMMLLTWAALAFVVGVLYSPVWPFEEALRPQRLWLLASQPMIILAAIGLVAVGELLLEGRWARPRLVMPAVVVVVLVASLPATVATVKLVSSMWTQPTYAHLDLEADRVPSLGPLVGGPGPRETILTYEDWGSLTWYLTGQAVVGVVPAGYAKLAYDPARFTPFGQAERRALVLQAFDGDISDLVGVAATTGARKILIARAIDGRWGTFDASTAAVLAASGGASDGVSLVEGNGWDAVALSSGRELAISSSGLPVSGMRLEVRVLGGDLPATLEIRARDADGDHLLASLRVSARPKQLLVLSAEVDPLAADALVLTADGTVTVQSLRGYVPPPALPLGWRIRTVTDDAIVLEREP